MLALDISRTPGRSELPPELAYLATRLRWRYPDLPPPLALEWSDDPVVALDRGVPWLYGPAERDPVLGPHGPAVLPARKRRQLASSAARGPRFDAVTVAHEIDPAGPVRRLLPVLEHGPRRCGDELARTLVGPVPGHPVVTRAARLLDALAGGAVAAFALDLLLDPIVFGVVGPSGLIDGVPSLWFPLAAWRW